ncbi:MAG: hypothetical protein IT384_08640 [Deltaproteobacteria bacterium]|nr:hypothetical protein [Deltaproteobacteria bacterium]
MKLRSHVALPLGAAVVMVLAGVGASRTASADQVVLKDGERIEGIVHEDGDQVVIELDFGTMSIDRAEVASIERAPTALSEVEKKRESLRAGDVEGLYRLAMEAEKLGLSSKSRALYREVVQLSPEHKGARAALGYRQHQGRWMTEDEFMLAQGYVKHRDRWITPDALKAIEHAETERRQRAQAEADHARIAQLESEVAKARAEASTARAQAEQAKALAEEEQWGFVPVWGPGGYSVQSYGGGFGVHINAPPVSVNIGSPGAGPQKNPRPAFAPKPAPARPPATRARGGR